MAAAAHLLRLLADSEIRESHREHDSRVQDAYCLRCMPQVHGAVRDVLAHVAGVLEIEAGSATDNPLVFPGLGARQRGGVVGRQFSWSAAGVCVRLRGVGDDGSGRHDGAADRPAAESGHQRGAAGVSCRPIRGYRRGS